MKKEEAMEILKDFHDESATFSVRTALETLHPELKEGEDERTRKAILTGLIDCRDAPDLGWSNFGGINIDECIAWIKKQGGKKPTDKVEPKYEAKFHEGNWVFIEEVKGYKNGPFQIKTVDSFGYSFDEYHTIPFMYEELLSKWTIQDAKEGDVLSYRDGQWIFIFKRRIDKDSFEYYALWSTIHNDLTINDSAFSLLTNSIYPATKEQRDLLFQKMKEAGYEWNNEKKKELKLLITNGGDFESENCEQKHVEWSEEDEEYLDDIFQFYNTEKHCQKHDDSDIANWLKSLKERIKNA